MLHDYFLVPLTEPSRERGYHARAAFVRGIASQSSEGLLSTIVEAHELRIENKSLVNNHPQRNLTLWPPMPEPWATFAQKSAPPSSVPPLVVSSFDETKTNINYPKDLKGTVLMWLPLPPIANASMV